MIKESEVQIDSEIEKIKQLKCPNTQEILQHSDKFEIGGTQYKNLFKYLEFSLEPCHGAGCETNETLISEYFYENPMRMIWFDSFLSGQDLTKVDHKEVDLLNNLDKFKQEYGQYALPTIQKQFYFSFSDNTAKIVHDEEIEQEIQYGSMRMEHSDTKDRVKNTSAFVKYFIMQDSQFNLAQLEVVPKA